MRLPLPARWLLRLVPAEWRESVTGDLQEERARRRARGRQAGALWATSAAVAVMFRLRREARHHHVAMPREPRQTFVDTIGTELRQAWRGVIANRRESAAVVAILAIGLGATVTVFTFANWILLRPIPGVREPARLVSIGLGTDDGIRVPIAYVDVEALAKSPALSGLAGFQSFPAHVAVEGGDIRRVNSEVVGGTYFSVLGDPLYLGRGFAGVDNAMLAAAPQAVISHRLWRQLLHGERDVLGRVLFVNRERVTIVGVAARGFHGTALAADADVWLPAAAMRVASDSYKNPLTDRRQAFFFGLVGRLTDGATTGDAATQVETTRAAIAAGNPTDSRIGRFRFITEPGARPSAWARRGLTDAFTLLMAMVGLLLVATIANVGQLMIARTTHRRSEIAARLALGASPGRVTRLLALESLMLSAAASVVAVLAATGIGALADGMLFSRGLPPLTRPEVEWPVVVFAVGICALVGMFAAVAPALAARRVDVLTALRQTGRSHTGATPYLRRGLAMAQITMSLALVVGALLLSRSIAAKLAVDPGFDATRVLSFAVDPALQRYGTTRPTLFHDLLDRVRRVPGVRAAAVSWVRPSFQGVGTDRNFEVEGGTEGAKFSANTNQVGPGYFDAIGLPIVEGRDFLASESGPEATTPCQCVVMTASIARAALGPNPVGRRIRFSSPTTPLTVIGIVGDTRQQQLLGSTLDVIYRPYVASANARWATIVVGLSGPAASVTPLLRRAVADVDPTLPVYDLLRIDEAIRTQFVDDLLVMQLARVFAVLATIVAAVGLAAILSRLVAERRREFGIRVALGATPRGIARLVAGEAGIVLAAGIALGLAASWWIAGLLTSRLFGVVRGDMWSYGLGLAMIVVVMFVCALPALRRAARLDPTIAMRE